MIFIVAFHCVWYAAKSLLHWSARLQKTFPVVRTNAICNCVAGSNLPHTFLFTRLANFKVSNTYSFSLQFPTKLAKRLRQASRFSYESRLRLHTQELTITLFRQKHIDRNLNFTDRL